MSDELATTKPNQIATISGILAKSQNKFATEKAQASVSGAGYMPYCGIVAKTGRVNDLDPTKSGEWYLMQGKEITYFGKEILMVLYAWRPRAMDFGNKITTFKTESEAFKDIVARSSVRGSQCAYGPEFLVSVPAAGDIIASYFMSSETARNESPNVIALLKNSETGFAACKQESELIKGEKYSWYGPRTKSYELEIDTFPDFQELHAAVSKFNSPPDDVEVVKEETQPETARD